MTSLAPAGERAALYAALLSPRSIALVGASDSPGKNTARPLEYLRRHRWAGVVHPVNPTRPTVLGQRAHPTLRDLPEVPDHVFVMTPADAAVEAVTQAAQLGVPVVTVMADGFVGTSAEAIRRLDALLAGVAGTGTRLLGPSSLGVARPATGFTLTANAAFSEVDLPGGPVFLASQSGSAMGALLSRGLEMGVGFAGMVSTGGEIDLTLGEICASSLDDPEIRSYALFLENISGAGDLGAFARAAAEAGKPVLAYKIGRSRAGAALAVSHTGALAGDDAVADALLRDLGIARVATFEALLEGQALAGRVPVRTCGPRPPRIGVVSTTGGGGAMVVDCLSARGAEPIGPSGETVARLAAVGIDAGDGALVDLTLAGTRYDVMRSALEILLTAPEFDAVVAVPGNSARFHPDLAVQPIIDVQGTVPLAAFVVPAAPEAMRLLHHAGVPAFRTPESCADALVAVLGRRAPRGGPGPRLAEPSTTRLLDEAASYEALAGVGVSSAAHEVLDLAAIPSELPLAGPVAVKVLSAELAHKSDAGGVVLPVHDAPGVREAAAAIVRRVGERAPQVAVEKLLVQQLVHGLGEALVGFRRDPDAGPIVVLAAGGVLAELYDARSIRLAPVDLGVAREMVGEVTALRALDGYRGREPGDLEALAQLVVAMSHLGEHPDLVVLEAEVNPVMVLRAGAGAVAVDALVRVAT